MQNPILCSNPKAICFEKEQQAVSLVSECPGKSPRLLCGRVWAGGDWWWSRVYGRDNVNLFFSAIMNVVTGKVTTVVGAVILVTGVAHVTDAVDHRNWCRV